MCPLVSVTHVLFRSTNTQTFNKKKEKQKWLKNKAKGSRLFTLNTVNDITKGLKMTSAEKKTHTHAKKDAIRWGNIPQAWGKKK